METEALWKRAGDLDALFKFFFGLYLPLLALEIMELLLFPYWLLLTNNFQFWVDICYGLNYFDTSDSSIFSHQMSILWKINRMFFI